MEINRRNTISLDYNSDDLPKSVKKLKPILFHEGNAFCCLLGPDPQEGIFGCGNTEKEALEDWDKHAKERVMKMDRNDTIVHTFLKQLKTDMDDLW
jgi:hypothetical protein